jgi:DNA-directed RNA polymerase subunit RPC12/RpoP
MNKEVIREPKTKYKQPTNTVCVCGRKYWLDEKNKWVKCPCGVRVIKRGFK